VDAVLALDADLGRLHRSPSDTRSGCSCAGAPRSTRPNPTGSSAYTPRRGGPAYHLRRDQLAAHRRPSVVEAPASWPAMGTVAATPGGHATTIDHITPRSRGGRNGWLNTVAACHGCNQRKGDRTRRNGHDVADQAGGPDLGRARRALMRTRGRVLPPRPGPPFPARPTGRTPDSGSGNRGSNPWLGASVFVAQ
jgi:HNH endonuclease